MTDKIFPVTGPRLRPLPQWPSKVEVLELEPPLLKWGISKVPVNCKRTI